MSLDQLLASSQEERLPPPLADFVIYVRAGKIFMRYAPCDLDDLGRRAEIALPEVELSHSEEDLTTAFIRTYGHLSRAEPGTEEAAPKWEHECGYTRAAWETGSEQGLQGDLASVIRVIADRRDLQLAEGLVLLWAYSRTPSSEARLGLESFEIFATKSFTPFAGSLRHEFIDELKQLEKGLFARNRPAGCGNKPLHSGSHSPLRFVLPIEGSVVTSPGIPGPLERYADIVASGRSRTKPS